MSVAIVVDVSVSAGWVLPDERNGLADRLLERVLAGELRLVAPETWYLETMNVLRNAVRRNRMTVDEVWPALDFADRLPLTIAPNAVEERRALMRHALEHGLTPYDAAYFHLAQTQRISLISADSDLLGLRGRFAWIRSLEDFCARDV